MSDITVRPGGDADLGALAALRWAWVVEENGTPGIVDRGTFIREFVTWAHAHSTTHRPFVAVSAGEIVGMAWLALYPRVPSPRSLVRTTGDIQSVYVLPALRDRGIGGRLVSAVVDWSAEAGVEIVAVHSSPAAVATYTRAGFRSEAELLRLRVRPVD